MLARQAIRARAHAALMLPGLSEMIAKSRFQLTAGRQVGHFWKGVHELLLGIEQIVKLANEMLAQGCSAGHPDASGSMLVQRMCQRSRSRRGCGRRYRVPRAAPNVSHASGSPVVNPRRNHS